MGSDSTPVISGNETQNDLRKAIAITFHLSMTRLFRPASALSRIGSVEGPDLAPDVYNELRRIAERCFRGQSAEHTLQPTALVNEAWLKLAATHRWNDRNHFLALAARAMRQVLIDHARKQGAARRGGSWGRVTLSGHAELEGVPRLDVLALDEALQQLETVDARQVHMIELRFFGGLTAKEIAAVLDVSKRTVELDLSMARAWLARALAADDDQEVGHHA